ncbi:uncharacterized protein LDX57_002532 [Aspergillus melleus]|uniref:uncharacterized protein n=1 Tax=Aspergillus melleus TaxID=138277 RepID=UPI001E8CA117|nr:uncharacterized protein LDX57_002532 [Aspergillus melleus]KAH8424789.1 hypothetical protein LDX57_002532 [Aspergillus melleus]
MSFGRFGRWNPELGPKNAVRYKNLENGAPWCEVYRPESHRHLLKTGWIAVEHGTDVAPAKNLRSRIGSASSSVIPTLTKPVVKKTATPSSSAKAKAGQSSASKALADPSSAKRATSKGGEPELKRIKTDDPSLETITVPKAAYEDLFTRCRRFEEDMLELLDPCNRMMSAVQAIEDNSIDFGHAWKEFKRAVERLHPEIYGPEAVRIHNPVPGVSPELWAVWTPEMKKSAWDFEDAKNKTAAGSASPVVGSNNKGKGKSPAVVVSDDEEGLEELVEAEEPEGSEVVAGEDEEEAVSPTPAPRK